MKTAILTKPKKQKTGDICEVECIHAGKVNAVRSLMKPEEHFFRLAETLKIIGDPTRLKILYALAHEELCVCDVANLLCLSKSLVSHHLRLLKAMRLVRYRREGKMAFYVLDDEHIINIFDMGFQHIEE
ncbi:MAG TPA: metalloregulator ArsR/SmtB family transcription factor [Spirochaetota bacterium]|nr:metalloregulator ArsR/SmtB family transcription factor [Spirochaetota bacterium]